MLCRLCDEYDLLEVRSESEWETFSRAAALDPGSLHLDFDRGRVVGVVAYVGEPIAHIWPVEIESLACRGRSTWVEARLGPSLYHTISAPGYCTFTYVKRPYPVRLVRVGHRTFYLQG
jgi:hypothetical protein